MAFANLGPAIKTPGSAAVGGGSVAFIVIDELVKHAALSWVIEEIRSALGDWGVLTFINTHPMVAYGLLLLAWLAFVFYRAYKHPHAEETPGLPTISLDVSGTKAVANTGNAGRDLKIEVHHHHTASPKPDIEQTVPAPPSAGSRKDGPVLVLDKDVDSRVQVHNEQCFYRLVLSNDQQNFDAPARDIRARLIFRNDRHDQEVIVERAVFIDRHTMDATAVIDRIFPALHSRKSVELVLVGQSQDFQSFETFRSPFDHTEEETPLLFEGIWTCDITVTAVYDAKIITLPSSWEVHLWRGTHVKISMLN